MASKYSDMDDILSKNPLHEFASYNTIFTLSGINETQLRSSSYLTDQITEVIAMSGEIGSPLGATQFAGNDFLADQKASDHLTARYELTVPHNAVTTGHRINANDF